MSTVLSDVAVFEVVDVASSARLAERLAEQWNVSLSPDGRDVMVVLVELGGRRDELADLLREVEAWVEEESLCALRYELDGRAYVLEAGETDWSRDLTRESVVEQRARLIDALESVERAIEARENADGQKPQIRGLEGLRKDLALALRLIDESS